MPRQERRQRRGRRRKISLPVVYSVGRCEAKARLAEISERGALLHSKTSSPNLGARIAVHVPKHPHRPFRGIVTRRTASGFAIRFSGEGRRAPITRRDLEMDDQPSATPKGLR